MHIIWLGKKSWKINIDNTLKLKMRKRIRRLKFFLVLLGPGWGRERVFFVEEDFFFLKLYELKKFFKALKLGLWVNIVFLVDAAFSIGLVLFLVGLVLFLVGFKFFGFCLCNKAKVF